jgi:hypothetical protein
MGVGRPSFLVSDAAFAVQDYSKGARRFWVQLDPDAVSHCDNCGMAVIGGRVQSYVVQPYR